MTNNQTEKEEWIEKVLHLRAYLDQEQDVTKGICQNYEKAQNELSNMIDVGHQLCLDLKAEYLQKIEALNQEMRHLQYQASQDIEKYRHQLSELQN